MEPLKYTDQHILEYMGKNLVVKVDVISNLEKYEAYDTSYVNMSLELTNNGSLDIPAGTWRIYFYRYAM